MFRIIGLQLVSEFDFVSDTEGQCTSFSHAAVGSAPMCIIKTVFQGPTVICNAVG